MPVRNVLYIHSHDTGRWISPYGYAAPTPHLQTLAEDGVVFRAAFSMAPTCSPSRAALLTGMAPHSAGMLGLAHRGFRLNDDHQHLASYLGQHGWETVLCGVQHEAPHDAVPFYQHSLHGGPHVSGDDAGVAQQDMANARAAADYLRQPHRRPFFLSFGMLSTHRDFPPADPDIDPAYVALPHSLVDTAENRADMAGFLTATRVVDRCVGMLLAALHESGRIDDTLIVYTTDHGPPFPGMKCTLHDGGIGVALLVRVPGLRTPQRAIDALVSQIDLFPTVCELADVPPPAWLQGVSLVPLLAGRAPRVREQIFAEVTFHAAYEPMRCIRTERYKFIRRFDERNRPVPANVDDSPGKELLIAAGWLDRPCERALLFDLALDPVERINRITEPGYAAVRRDLEQQLERWMQATNDPLLHGPVRKPPGAVVNTRDCLSPSMAEYE